MREPLSVTDHGCESLVVMSADEYKRLKALDTRHAVYSWELPDDLAAALETAKTPSHASKFNHELG